MFNRSLKPRSNADADPADAEVEPASPVAKAPPKGKATPKRREAELRRRTTVIEQAGGRRGGRETRAQAVARRAALARGDESALPSRDRGPVRRFARDFVDSRRSVIGMFLPIGVPLLLISLFISVASLLLYVFFLAVLIDSMLLSRKLKAQAHERFPGESTSGLGMYAVSRASMVRKFRLPKPRVEVGDKI